MTEPEAAVHLQGAEVRATTRGIDGIHDIQLLDGLWRCSCGRPDQCAHVAAVGEALADRAAND
jgi:hypothetical protein